MSITLDHTIVHATDNLASARFLAEILGVDPPAHPGHFAPVVSDNGVTLDFTTVAEPSPHHYAFLVRSADFDAAYERVRDHGLTIYAGPDRSGEGEMNHRGGQRGFYFDDPDGNWMELIERPDELAIDPAIGTTVDEWAAAETAGDTERLDRLLADDFHGIGAAGFVLDKAAWLGRFADGLRNESFDVENVEIHGDGSRAVVIAVVDQRTFFGDADVSGRYRVSCTVARDGGRWRIASCHIGALDPRAVRT